MIALAAPISTLCAAVLALGQPAAPPAVARAACELVAASAEAHGVDPVLAAAVAWEESRLSPDAHSRAGAHGVMQASKALRAGAVSDIGAGVEELARLLGRHAPRRAVTHYNCGRCANPAARARSDRWAGAVLRTAGRLRASMDKPRRVADEAAVSGCVPGAHCPGTSCLPHPGRVLPSWGRATAVWAAGRREGQFLNRRRGRLLLRGNLR